MEKYIQATEKWLNEWVIDLNLCPFASSVVKKGRVRLIVSKARNEEALLHDLLTEIELLLNKTAEEIDTSLIVHPFTLTDFHDYLDFVSLVEDALTEIGLEGVLQLATFHPHYQFEGTEKDDRSNYTNRSPFPTLHLLREASVEAALSNYKDPAAIPERNITLLREMPNAQFSKLKKG